MHAAQSHLESRSWVLLNTGSYCEGMLEVVSTPVAWKAFKWRDSFLKPSFKVKDCKWESAVSSSTSRARPGGTAFLT